MRRKPILTRSLPNRTMREVVACMISPVATGVFILASFDTSPLLGFEMLVFAFSILTPIWLWHATRRIHRQDNNPNSKRP
jgi:hypothetical protein